MMCESTSTTRKPRTCETEGCERNSGDAWFCRNCRAVRPYLATIAEQKSSITSLRAERDAATTTVRQLTEQVGTLTIERDACHVDLQRLYARYQETRNEVRGLRADLDAAKVYATDQAKRLQAMKRERDDWQSVAVANAADRDRARDEVDTLRVRLRFMYAAAWVLLVAVVVLAGGVA